MQIRALTSGSVTSTGTLTVQSGIVGGVLITTNNSDQGTVILRRDDGSGKPIFDLDTATTIFVAAPISMENTQTLYYSVSGTGCSAQIYEWVE